MVSHHLGELENLRQEGLKPGEKLHWGLQGNGKGGEAYSSKIGPGEMLDERNERWMKRRGMGEEGRYLSPTGRKTLESGARDWWGQSSLQVAAVENIDGSTRSIK